MSVFELDCVIIDVVIASASVTILSSPPHRRSPIRLFAVLLFVLTLVAGHDAPLRLEVYFICLCACLVHLAGEVDLNEHKLEQFPVGAEKAFQAHHLSPSK